MRIKVHNSRHSVSYLQLKLQYNKMADSKVIVIVHDGSDDDGDAVMLKKRTFEEIVMNRTNSLGNFLALPLIIKPEQS